MIEIDEDFAILNESEGFTPNFRLMQLIVMRVSKPVYKIVSDKNLAYEKKLSILKYYYLQTFHDEVLINGKFLNIIKRIMIKKALKDLSKEGNIEAKKLLNDLMNDKDILEKSKIKGGLNEKKE
jgi:hypothetical protein